MVKFHSTHSCQVYLKIFHVQWSKLYYCFQKQDFLSDDRNIEDSIAEQQESSIRLQLLAQAMNKLNERERTIIKARKLSETPDTLDALGEQLGISRERVRQIENRAVEKMTQFIQAHASSLTWNFLQ